MRLTDIMSGAGLTSWAELGLIVSFVTFAAIAVWVLSRRKATWERARFLPLDDELEGRESQ